MATIGNYKIIEQIGEGGFARTYKAKHKLLDEYSCLKQNINISKEDETILRNEAKLLWQIHHHSLPTLRDYFLTEDGSAVLAMSYIEGKELGKSIEKHKAIHPEEVAWMTQRLLNALHYLHKKGVVHADIKPTNIIVQPTEHNAILVDYGLSVNRPKSGTKASGYTPIFAAPEITDGRPPIPESDFYSLGMTMIYTLGGDPVSKTIPDYVPEPMAKYLGDLVKYNPTERPNWGLEDMVSKWSDVRLESFGRRNTSDKKTPTK